MSGLLDDFDSVETSSKSSGENRSILDDFDTTPGRKGSASEKSVPDAGITPSPQKEKTLLQRAAGKVIGDLEAAGSLASGAIAAPIGAAAGVFKGFTGGKYGTAQGAREAQQYAGEVADSLTYKPRTEGGQEKVGMVGRLLEDSKLAGLGPSEGITLAGVSAGPARIPKAVPQAQPSTLSPRFASVGASGASGIEQAKALAANASPEIQAAVNKVGTDVSIPVLERHVQANSLPVPIKLTKGQATQDPVLISREQNRKGQYQEYSTRFDEQNKALIENTNAIRDSAAPDVYTTTKPAHGEALIDSYKAKDASLNAEISKRYKALSDANGGQFPLDGKTFVTSAEDALHKELLFDHVPEGMRKTLDRLKDGQPMTFENFESLRTNLARVMRSNADGNQKAAAGVIRNALEDMPMPPGAENLKPLADAARQAARERFSLIEGDPAYKAVVRGTASADKFIDKYVVGADLKNVQTMKQNLSHDPVAQQTMAAGTVDQLKDSARIIDNTGNFSQAGYNKALEKIRPKLDVLFGPEHKTQLEDLGAVSRYTQAQPRGSFVNNSNTFTSAIAEHAKGAAESVVPGMGLVRKLSGMYSRNKEIKDTLQPAAGISLKDVGAK